MYEGFENSADSWGEKIDDVLRKDKKDFLSGHQISFLSLKYDRDAGRTLVDGLCKTTFKNNFKEKLLISRLTYIRAAREKRPCNRHLPTKAYSHSRLSFSSFMPS